MPVRFSPVYKPVIWGGQRIAPYKGVTISQQSVGESWEISAIPGQETTVAEGPLLGMTLQQLISMYGSRLLGNRLVDSGITEFPLLIKFIDASKDLSIQVHPGEIIARSRHNCSGKTEMWYIIDAAQDSHVLSGFSSPINSEQYRKQVSNGEILNSLAIHKTKPGDVYFIPSGRVHAIGKGNFILEVQQSSDITYRIYDYDRRDKDGNPRQLHTDQAVEAVDYKIYNNYKIEPRKLNQNTSELIKCSEFEVKLIEIDGDIIVNMPAGSFLTMTCVEGSATLATPNYSTDLHQGHTILIPAEITEISLKGSGKIVTANC